MQMRRNKLSFSLDDEQRNILEAENSETTVNAEEHRVTVHEEGIENKRCEELNSTMATMATVLSSDLSFVFISYKYQSYFSL
jgi:hypothetical protein